MKSFQYKNLEIFVHSEVYDPAEDSFLLIDAIEVKKDDLVFELGAGTGIISLNCALFGANVICSDINPHAVENIKLNYSKNRSKIPGSINVRFGDFFSVLKKDEFFDIIIFNPPYLPTEKNELVGGSGWFDKATDGGKTGLDFTIRFLKELSKFLKPTGSAYFVFSSLSNKNLLIPYLTNFDYKIKKSMIFDDEKLDIYKLKLKK